MAALSRALVRDCTARISQLCFAQSVATTGVYLCRYDVTTLYFEVEHEDELRQVGSSTERRVDPQRDRTNRRAEPVWGPEAFPHAWRAVWQYRCKRAMRDEQTLNKQRNHAQEVIEGTFAEDRAVREDHRRETDLRRVFLPASNGPAGVEGLCIDHRSRHHSCRGGPQKVCNSGDGR